MDEKKSYRKEEVVNFRLLRADEIECRVGMIKESGLSLLLYKDARCDMAILDETFGAFGWQRHHSRENANCVVSIWDPAKEQWIDKEDVGTASMTEAEKGIASDSFKRACVNVGIGRELYTAPFIWIPADKYEARAAGRDRYGDVKYKTYDRFRVTSIDYDKARTICSLEIVNEKSGEIVYTLGARKKASADKKTDAPMIDPHAPIPKRNVDIIESWIKKTGTDRAAFVGWAGKEPKDFTMEDYGKAFRMLKEKEERMNHTQREIKV